MPINGIWLAYNTHCVSLVVVRGADAMKFSRGYWSGAPITSADSSFGWRGGFFLLVSKRGSLLAVLGGWVLLVFHSIRAFCVIRGGEKQGGKKGDCLFDFFHPLFRRPSLMTSGRVRVRIWQTVAHWKRTPISYEVNELVKAFWLPSPLQCVVKDLHLRATHSKRNVTNIHWPPTLCKYTLKGNEGDLVLNHFWVVFN